MSDDWADELRSFISGRIRAAREKASRIGRVVGIVSRKSPSRLSGELTATIVEVDPRTYYEKGASLGVGNYLVAVDLRTLKAVGLRILSVVRADVASTLESLAPLRLEEDEEGLLTNALIEATPLLDEDGLPVSTPIEPQSPVAIPSDPDTLMKVIGIPQDGIVLGYLHTGSVPVAGGSIPLKLPRQEFFKHTFVVGTTGAGKTTFIKNLMYAMARQWPEARLLVIDAAGDYAQVAVPPARRPSDATVLGGFEDVLKNYPSWITVLLPVRRGDSKLVRLALRYVMERVGKMIRAFHGLEPELSVVEDGRDFDWVNSVVVKCRVGTHEFSVEVVPVSLTYAQLKDHLEILPLFSRQAKVYLRYVIGYLENVAGNITNFTHLYRLFQEKIDEVRRVMKLHLKTLENMERALNFIASAEEVDVIIERRLIGMPTMETVMRNYRGPVVVDLDYAAMRGAHFLVLNLIAYEILRDLYVWKKSGTGLTTPALVVLDEAHRFFPSEGTSREEVELLADFISRIARLGRSRGLGLIFSTHSPKDVHKIVIQLANTKVILRSEREFLEMLDIPKEYLRLMELAPDRVALLRSSVVRSGYAIFRTPEPVLGHYDIGRLAAGLGSSSGNLYPLSAT